MKWLPVIPLFRTAQSYVQVHLEQGSAASSDWSFEEAFCIGRDAACQVCIASELVSRHHADVFYGEGNWWVQDRSSTNGTYLNGQRITRACLEGQTRLQFGSDGPVVLLTVIPGEDEKERFVSRRARGAAPQGGGKESQVSSEDRVPAPLLSRGSRPTAPEVIGASSGKRDPPRTVEDYKQYYFDAQTGPAGERTMMIRWAFAQVQERHRRRYGRFILGLLALVAVAAGFAIYQHSEVVKLKKQQEHAEVLFSMMKEQELAMAQLRLAIEEQGNSSLKRRLAQQEERRRALEDQYEGYVEELGIRRKLANDEERLIYKKARVFNESDVAIPAEFIRAVKDEIQNYWLSDQGRGRFIRAVQRAEASGYTEHIVRTMQHYGLPPEFFYLALQESGFDVRAVGPSTRFGYAKGMWQFIPKTARRFSLVTGPQEAEPFFDEQDERHDFAKSTEAAAKYLLEIYATLAQASGLLTMASYNWGECRVGDKLEDLTGSPLKDLEDCDEQALSYGMAETPKEVVEEALEGVRLTPRDRSYWRFYETYKDRMPEQTKEYVIRIFAAAVIGENPELFGFHGLENPLAKYLSVPDTEH